MAGQIKRHSIKKQLLPEDEKEIDNALIKGEGERERERERGNRKRGGTEGQRERSRKKIR